MVALGLAVLWSTIIWIDVDTVFGENLSRRRGCSLGWIQLCLSQSHQANLDVKLVGRGSEQELSSKVEHIGVLLNPYHSTLPSPPQTSSGPPHAIPHPFLCIHSPP